MKNLFLSRSLRALFPLALIAALSACGGYTSLDLRGTVSGVTYPGLVLANSDGGTVSVPVNATSYVFPSQVEISSTYNVSVKTQPQHLNCVVLNPTDISGRTVSINVSVLCSPNTYALTGTITGLTGSGLVLTNGGVTVSPAANANSFAFDTKIAYGVVYGIAVLTQPSGQVCRVANGTAVMGDADVTNVQVICKNQA